MYYLYNKNSNDRNKKKFKTQYDLFSDVQIDQQKKTERLVIGAHILETQYLVEVASQISHKWIRSSIKGTEASIWQAVGAKRGR